MVKINVTSNVGISVYQSGQNVQEGTNITLRARYFPGYKFDHWSDGSVTNPYTFTATVSVDIVAIYVKIADNPTPYDWYVYIKGQTALNQKIKSFRKVVSFDVGEDLCTTQTGTLTLETLDENISDGDIVALVDPEGYTKYYGVITAVNETENTIETKQMTAFYDDNWIYKTFNRTTIEAELKAILDNYATGKEVGSSWTDQLIVREKETIVVKATTQTSGKLEAKETKTVMKLSDLIYDIYNKYGIMLKWYIPFEEWDVGDTTGGSVEIFKPNYAVVKIGLDINAIKELTPSSQIEDVNRLLIYSEDGSTFRDAYVYTSNGIVSKPSSVGGRVANVNTSIVFSDDTKATIVAANLPDTLYNHQISFNLVENNYMYSASDFNLGGRIDVYIGDSYYNSVITGYKMSKTSEQTDVSLSYTCGKVRTSLTKKLKKRWGII